MSYPSLSRGTPYGSYRPSSHWQASQRRYQHDPRYQSADAAPTSSASQSKTSAAGAGQVWSSNPTSNYTAVYDADGPSSLRSAGKLRSNAHRSGTAKGDAPGLKGKDFSYAFIGKEAERYAREALSQQIDSFVTAAPGMGDTVAPSPLTSTTLKPGVIVEEFNRAGHYDRARSQLLSSFPTSQYKEFLMESLEKFLLKRIASLSPEERRKFNSQDTRIQELEIAKWIDDSTESVNIFDELFEKMREENAEQTGLFQSKGDVGKIINDGLAEVIDEQTRLAEQKKPETSDEDSNTPVHKGDSTPMQSGLDGSANQTPSSVAAPE